MTARPLAIAVAPDPGVSNALKAAQELCVAGRRAEARTVCNGILAQGANATALHLLGVITHQEGDLPRAIELLQQAVALAPQEISFRSNLGVMLQQARQFHLSEQILVECARAEPAVAEHHFKLGNLRRDQGRYTDAVHDYARALRLAPTHKQSLKNITITLWEDGQPDRAIAYAELAAELFEGSPEFLMLLAEAYAHAGRAAECEQTIVRAQAVGADPLSVALNLLGPYLARGAHREAVQMVENAMAQDTANPPSRHAMAFSNVLFSLNYLPDVSVDELMRRHRAWGEKFTFPAPAAHTNDRTADRALRIGYVSADFRSHSVAHFLMPLLDQHDREQFKIFCYSNTARPDSITQRITGACHAWRPITGMDDDSAARLIGADAIDILVDLGGHSADNRLLLFARKPAPVQVSWLGYPNTTGLPAMDFRISDEICDPAVEHGGGGTETVLRLPDGFHCFEPLATAPDVAPPPCLQRGHVTFGSFNTIAKLSDATLQAWSIILNQAPGSRLVIKNNGMSDAETGRAQRQRMAECGIDPNRVTFLPFEKGPADHLARYGEIDIALDPFPYNGTTTTCEALWMGVPVVTLLGDRHAARVGASLLTRIGRPEWIGATLDEHVRKTVALAADPGELARARMDLRGAMRQSPLCDRMGFARSIEAAFRDVWRRWCARSL
jgi:protein O-GlcNAc transferase